MKISTLLLNHFLRQKKNQETMRGFTLIELMAVILIIGILSAIAVPGWNGFVNRQRLRTSTDRIYNALGKAQNQAKLKKETWQASFRQTDVDLDRNGTIEADEQNRVQWAVHPEPDDNPTTNDEPDDLGLARSSDASSLYLWHALEQSIEIDTDNTTMSETDGVYTQGFGFLGNVDSTGDRGKITLFHTDMGETKRCVIVSTLLGGMRTAEDTDCQESD